MRLHAHRVDDGVRTAAGGEVEWGDVPGFWSQIGDHTLKYHAWGDGFDDVRFVSHADGGFTVWYASAGRVVGVLTSEADEDYERGEKLIADHASIEGIAPGTADPAQAARSST